MRNPFKKKTDRLIIISENDFHSRLLPVDYHVKTVLNDSGSITSIIKQGKLIEGNNQTSRSENLELPIIAVISSGMSFMIEKARN
tara:strand:- start:5823 stop:6077 length:255 start_codon:yes stop_codon:yes gene_type:complete